MDFYSLIVFVLMIVGLLIGIFSGYYLFAVLGGLGLIFGLLFWDYAVINLVTTSAFSTLGNYTMLAVPLFIFMGNIMEKSGLAGKIFHSLSLLLGRLKGGLAVAALIISLLFAASTGIVGATVVTMGLLFLPAMLDRKYDPKLATGVINSGGTLGILLPPSIMLIVYGPMAQISVGQLFYAVLIPGILLGIVYIIYVLIVAHVKPDSAPAIPKEELAKYTLKDKVIGVFHILPIAVIILAVLGSIWFGIAPPTEAAAIGSLAAMIVALCYGKLNIKVLKETVFNTLQTTSMIYAILFLGTFFVSVFMRLGGGDIVKEAFLSLSLGKWAILAIMLLVVFILGMLMDWIASLLIIVPIFTPIAADLGFDPIWFAAIICIMYQSSFITPPFAPAIFYLKGVAPKGVKTGDIMKGVIPFVLLQVFVLILCIIFPEIILWLPSKIIQ
ncbi:TRAP transporter large permease [Oceanobacillus salinisoli]|uniref:TRAP transporter large permease n=1 Tax=Oceanobacillus salinisoli TaxID=2678611 RepID=UPI0012E0FB68|nr:TRAP transporter large permease subunit [Oceanobacillus salinisoli]